MQSAFFKPVRLGLDETDDNSPAIVAILMPIFDFIPRLILSLLQLGAKMIRDAMNIFLESMRQVVHPSQEGHPRMGAGLEDYHSHPTLDHMVRIGELEKEVFNKYGGSIHDRHSHSSKSIEQRLGHIERIVHGR